MSICPARIAPRTMLVGPSPILLATGIPACASISRIMLPSSAPSVSILEPTTTGSAQAPGARRQSAARIRTANRDRIARQLRERSAGRKPRGSGSDATKAARYAKSARGRRGACRGSGIERLGAREAADIGEVAREVPVGCHHHAGAEPHRVEDGLVLGEQLLDERTQAGKP